MNKISKDIKGMKKNKIRSIIVILCVSFLFIILWINRNRLSIDSVTNWLEGRALSIGMGDGYPSDISGDEIEACNFALLDNDITLLTNTSFTVLNNTAKQMTNRPHKFNKPMMKTSGGRAILYDVGGKDYSIETIAKNIKSDKCENEIINCSISESGTYGILTESKDYLCEMTIYDKNSAEKYKYYFSEYYISNISLNNKGTNAVVCGISAEEGKLKSVVYVFDFKSEAPINKFEYEENMIREVKYINSGSVAVVGDKTAGVINLRTNTRKDFDYDKKFLTCFNIDTEEGIILSLSSVEGGQNCEIVLLDRNGNEIKRIATLYTITYITSKNNRIIGINDNEVFAYRTSGDADGNWRVANNIKAIQLKSTNLCYVLGVNKIYKLHLK